jgi:hypothetical protein
MIRALSTSASTSIFPPRLCQLHTSDLLALPDRLVLLVVLKEVHTELPEVIGMEVTMPTARRTRLPLENSDLASVVLAAVLLAQSRAKHSTRPYTHKAGSMDCTTDNSDVGLAALSNLCKLKFFHSCRLLGASLHHVSMNQSNLFLIYICKVKIMVIMRNLADEQSR